MAQNHNYSKTGRGKKDSIFKFYLFTIVVIGIASGFIFSFSFINFIISSSIVSLIFLIIFNYNKKSIPKVKNSKNRYENKDIRLCQPKINKDDSKLIELKLDTLNFKLNDIEKAPVNNIKSTIKSNTPKDKKLDDKTSQLKKMFNPYKSPFEPINQAQKIEIKNEESCPISLEQNNALDEVATVSEGEEQDYIVSDNLHIEDNSDNNLTDEFEYSNEKLDEIIDNDFEYEDYINNTNAAIGESYIIEDEEDNLEWEELRGEVNNILKFRPRERNEEPETSPKYIPKENEVIKEEQIEENYEYPPINILKHEFEKIENEIFSDEQEVTANKLIDALASFGVGAKVIDISKGPSVTRYELQPNPGVKVSKIVGLSDDIALNLAATGVRIEAPIPGKAAVGIEVPNKEVKPVYFGDVVRSKEFIQHPSKLAFALGKDVAGRTIVGDVAKMPHMLIAGATGSGKSVCINTLISSILYKASPDEVKLLLIDPKVVELGIYNGIPHLLIPVVTDPKKAAGALSWAVVEMTNRYKLFAENNVRDLKGYNSHMKSINEPMLPQIVIIIDELADLMMVAPNDVEDCICRLAQMARAAGMHLVIATQRPSVDVITGVIKANIPSRISFAVSSQIDSRTILDAAGAEKLLGRGDMLFNPIGEMKATRVQGSFISDSEVEALVSYLKGKHNASYDMDVLERINAKEQAAAQNDINDDDELLPQVVDMVIEYGQASASLIQRKFKVGYSRAARILDQMESWGIVGQADGSKPRQILITKEEWIELNS